MKLSIILAILIGVGISTTPALAQKKSGARTDQVRGVYEPPKDPKYKPIYDELRQRGVLEKMREMLSPLRLPRRLTLKFEGCDGVANAYYEEDTVTICYEYVEYIKDNAPKETTALGLTPANALIGPTVDVILHEIGHAVFDMLGIPVFGREEDAADLFSAYILLQFAPQDSRRLILGVSFLGAKEAMDAQKAAPTLKSFADAHGLPAQRYYNVLCIAYGKDPEIYAEAVKRGGLTQERAEGCADEYATLEHAFQRLIRPYVDQALLRKVRAKIHFRFDEPAPSKPAAAQ